MPSKKIAISYQSCFSSQDAKKNQADVLVVPVFKNNFNRLPQLLKKITNKKITKSLWKEMLVNESFVATYGEVASFNVVPGSKFQLILIGLGNLEDIEGYRFESAIVSGLLFIKNNSPRISVHLPIEKKILDRTKLIGIISAAHQFTYRSLQSLTPGPIIKKLNIISNKKIKNFKSISKIANTMGISRSKARDLVNTPPNKKNTNTLATFAKDLKSQYIQVKIQKNQKWIKKNMPCFFTVARGSLKSDPPRWITLHYKPKGKINHRISLVGKSVMFDTGGYQIKSGNFMRTMKADMTGGATVLALMNSLSVLQPKGIEVYAHLAATPNMINSDAFVPDDIVDTTCGKKVEIQHTDAEGRMTLIDAVSMAQKNKPEMILVIATLTGAASRAVGMRTALLSNHLKWREKFARSANIACDPYQKLDVVAEDYEAIKSKLDSADIKNTGNPKGRGAQSAAAFVFSGASPKLPIVQLDIAGGDMTLDDKSTGITVQAGIEFMLSLAK